MDKQIAESDPQQPSEQPGKMVAPEDVTYSQHDEKKEAKRKKARAIVDMPIPTMRPISTRRPDLDTQSIGSGNDANSDGVF